MMQLNTLPFPNELNHLQWPMAIVGLGVTGRSVLDLFETLKISQSLYTTFDTKDESAVYKDSEHLLTVFKPKTLCVSPGVPLSSPWIQNFIKTGGHITSELEIATYFLTSEKMVAVTGSLGKSTTVSLIQYALSQSKNLGFVGGNLGIPLATYINEKLKSQVAVKWIVLELSSYQLENYSNLDCDFSGITYFTSNHLERYPSKDDYYYTKWSLIKKTTKKSALNNQGGDLKSWAYDHKLMTSNLFFLDRNSDILKRFGLLSPSLIGSHNLDNLALAAQLLEWMEIEPALISKMKDFKGLPHRVENLGIKDGILFINDSKATTIESVLTATHSSLEKTLNKTLHLLLGGRDKNLPWEDLGVLCNKAGIKFYFFGECGEAAKQKSRLPGQSFKKLKEAFEYAKLQAKEGDAVLLSPGGTSLDEFKNFESRGQLFRQLATGEDKV